MTCTRWIRLLAVVLVAAVALCWSLQARAETSSQIIHESTDADGNTNRIIEYKNDTGTGWLWTVENAFGELVHAQWMTPINPDPVNGGGEPKDFDALMALLKKMGGARFLETDPLQTPAGEIVSQQGGSIVPHHNPSDLFQEAEEMGGGGHGGGFDPNGGSIVEQIKVNGPGNGGGDDDGGDDGHKEDYGFYDGQYPANPELVNPVPIQKGFVLLPPSTKGFRLTGRAGTSAMPGAAFNWGAFGGQSGGAGGTMGAARIAR